ncbi:hypothetical protein JZ751_013637, partial [Albula glossodonta]
NGWQLLWLCCGLFPPSGALLRHTQRFLESRPREPLAADCLQRLHGMLRMSPRKLPPHQVEIDAIQQNSTQIFHKVHFPNDTEEIFEVATATKIRDLCHSIANKLMLVSPDGYSLFVKTPDKVVSLKDEDYFFDCLRQITDWSKKAKRVKEGVQQSMPYVVFFMRKLWFNVSPGRDVLADLTFHFPQELPKYLRGYHRCTKEDVINLAGLLFRVKVDTDRSQFVMIPRMLKDLLPTDQLKAASPEDWKKNIIASYNKQAGMTVDEAKVAFLKVISQWPTFGCTFFEVKQTSMPKLPNIIRLAISKQGVMVIDPRNKEELETHPFNRIANWSSGSTYFHMTIGNLIKGNTLLCETSLGYKMDDLLTSYFDMYHNERKATNRRRSEGRRAVERCLPVNNVPSKDCRKATPLAPCPFLLPLQHSTGPEISPVHMPPPVTSLDSFPSHLLWGPAVACLTRGPSPPPTDNIPLYTGGTDRRKLLPALHT